MPTQDDDQKDGSEPFLSRWSRRKRQPGAPVSSSDDVAAHQNAAAAEIDLEQLPKLEDLNANSDFTAFLKRGVPEALKRAALRKAWSTDPLIRDFIEVAENQYNFNDPNGVPGFGELAKDTDIAALVRQAIGEREPKPVEVAEGGEPAIEPPKSETPHTVEAEAADQSSHETGSAAADVVAPQSEVAVASVRRHGGALPDADGLT